MSELQDKIKKIEAIKIERNKIQTVIVEKKAAESIKPIHPNRKLIIIFSLIPGGLLDIFAVFIIEFISWFKVKFNSESNLNVAKNELVKIVYHSYTHRSGYQLGK